MSSVKRMGKAWRIFPARSQGEQDAYYDDDQQLGYREPSEERSGQLKIELEIPTADAEALYRFIKGVNAREACHGDPYEASRLEGALDALIEAFEVDPSSI